LSTNKSQRGALSVGRFILLNGVTNFMNYANVWAVVLAGGEGTRVRSFLQQLCGGSGIKQFSAILGARSMLRCTLDRIGRLIPPERTLIIVGRHHRDEIEKQLPHWPRENIVFQPVNRDTAPGILLPLAHVTARDADATVAIFPSDHFVLNEDRFMAAVDKALRDADRNRDKLVLLGMLPERGAETEYGYIKLAHRASDGHAAPVSGFVEKPPLAYARELIRQGALWNTMVFVAHNTALWDMTAQTAPVLYHAFRLIQMTLHSPRSAEWVERIYDNIPNVNFSSAICAPLARRLRVLPVTDVGWSDWGTVGSILRTVEKLGRADDLFGRLEGAGATPSYWFDFNGFKGDDPDAPSIHGGVSKAI